MTPPDSQLSTAKAASGITIRDADEAMSFCQIIAKSRLCPKGLETPEALFLAVNMGMELGLSPMQAIQSIAVINGRPSIWGDAALAIVKGHPECVDVVETFEGKGEEGEGMAAICTVLRRDKEPVKRKFTVKMAKTAQLWGKSGPWTQYPTRMLQMRARSWALRDAFPDALKGVGVREEVQDIPARAHLVERPQKALTLPGGETIQPEPQKALEAPQEAAAEPYEPGADEEEEQRDPVTGQYLL